MSCFFLFSALLFPFFVCFSQVNINTIVVCSLELSVNAPCRFLCGPHFSCSFHVNLKGGYGRWGRDRYGPPIRTDYRLIVENLSSRCSWQDLKVRVSFD